ncbi:MAG: efflux RND transporter permease subunit [Planctomycetota bacterium]|jgi:HAE1 family hydrophobic/amphiphilic exporter-1|nr:efflux RND transporter permease subunit [Planctomycetota bacterium]
MTSKGGLLALGVHRPVGVLMVFSALVVFGFVSLGKLPFDLLPQVDYPSITVRTTWSGAAPEDLEERVTERLEDALATVGGLERMRSSSRAELSEILLEFEWGSNLSFLVQDVRERLDRVFLPSGVERPLILRYDPSLDPVLRLALSGDEDLVRLRDVAEQEIERTLEALDGVAAVKVRGGLEDEIQVLLDTQRLAALNLTPEAIRQRLQDENLNVPGGKLEEGAVEYVVRTLNEFRTLDEISSLPIVQKGSASILLSDIARVSRTHKDRDVVLRVGGKEAVEIDIFREAGSNIVDVAASVHARLFEKPAESSSSSRRGGQHSSSGRGRMQKKSLVEKLPPGMKLTVLSDQSLFVRGAISEVQGAAFVGGLLAILVCFLFLRRLAITAIIGLAIPVSIIATFGAMYVAEVSMNVMSLGGLALGIGMLVDNAIVVLESVSRCRDEGDDPLDAAVRGVREVGSAVTASTLTTIAVFAPIIFVEGVAGQVFGDQALTVVSSLLLSLTVALFFIPGLAARFHMDEGRRPTSERPVLFARIRSGLFKNLPQGNPHKKKLRVFIGSLSVVAWLSLSAWKNSVMAPYAEQLKWGGWGIPDEAKELSAALGFWALVALIPFLWTGGRSLFLVLGRFFADTSGLLSSLFRALLFIVFVPLGWVLRPAASCVEVAQKKLDSKYPALLRRTLTRPGLVLGLTVLLVLATLQASQKLGRELLPEVMQGELTAELIFPSGYPLEETDSLTTKLEKKISSIPGIRDSAAVSGADRESISNDEDGPHVGRITIRLDDVPNRRVLESEVESKLRHLLSRQPELRRFEIRRPTLLALKAPLEVEVYAEDLSELSVITDSVLERLLGIPGVLDLRSSLRKGNPEVRVVLDRERLAEHNLNLGQVATRLRLAVEGEVATTFPESDERLDIRVRADLSEMQTVEQLRDLPVNPEAERPLPLGAVAELTTAFGPSEIRHIGSRRAAILSASVATDGLSLGEISGEMDSALADLSLPLASSVLIGGQKQEMEQALSSLNFALLLAIFLVYAVMAAQFESLLQPFVIMFSVPLAGIGAAWALLLSGTPVSVVALLGFVVLAGIVVNNAIVLVDRMNRNRRTGMSLDDSIVEAAQTRLRPILMTTFTTVLGMIPLTGWLAGVGNAEGTELRAPMALVVIAGLLSSTLLTLLVIPVIYRTVEKISPAARND